MGINSAAPPLADDIYMFVCHGHDSARERFIVRMGMALNKALYAENNGKKDWVEQLGYAMLSIPAGAALLGLVAECQLNEQTKPTLFVLPTQCLDRAYPGRSACPAELAVVRS